MRLILAARRLLDLLGSVKAGKFHKSPRDSVTSFCGICGRGHDAQSDPGGAGIPALLRDPDPPHAFGAGTVIKFRDAEILEGELCGTEIDRGDRGDTLGNFLAVMKQLDLEYRRKRGRVRIFNDDRSVDRLIDLEHFPGYLDRDPQRTIEIVLKHVFRGARTAYQTKT